MGDGKYIWCRNCEAIHHVSSFDQSPVYQIASGDVQEIPANDWREFMAKHAGHKLEPLTATGKGYFSGGSGADPMTAAYIEASNGSETLLLRRSRRSIDEPVRYEILKGRLVENGVGLEIQEKEIRKEMKLHFSWAPAAPLEDEKINLFVALFRDIVRELDPQNVRPVEFSFDDDNISYGQLDSSIVEALMTRCAGHFLPLELASIRRFVETHREACDVMALIKRRAVSVEQSAE
jgi:hypothetical protein